MTGKTLKLSIKIKYIRAKCAGYTLQLRKPDETYRINQTNYSTNQRTVNTFLDEPD